MAALVNLWNKIDLGGDKVPTSITTISAEYRERFLKMYEGFVEVIQPGSASVGSADDSV